jgi:hypothetical protein
MKCMSPRQINKPARYLAFACGRAVKHPVSCCCQCMQLRLMLKITTMKNTFTNLCEYEGCSLGLYRLERLISAPPGASLLRMPSPPALSQPETQQVWHAAVQQLPGEALHTPAVDHCTRQGDGLHRRGAVYCSWPYHKEAQMSSPVASRAHTLT